MSLYANLFYSSEVAPLLSDEATVQHMLRFEAALAQAQATHGLIPATAAEQIAACCQVNLFDLDQLREAIPLSGNAAIPLVKQLTTLVQQQDAEAAKFVHLGATSQDVVDTATVLTIKYFLGWLEQQLSGLITSLSALTRTHRETVMIGRTLLQQARPITFGLKTVYWLDGLGRSQQRLVECQKRVLVLELAGAVGGRNESIPAPVYQAVATQLELHSSASWHTQRDGLVEFAANLGILTGSLAKIAKDVSLLMQTEVAEVLEGKAEGKGGSSTMPHKRNPVTTTAILANAHRVPQLVSTLLAAMPQEHERSAGLWHSEWEVLTELMQLTAGVVQRSRELIDHLEIDEQRMRQNLELTNGLIYAESVSLALAPKLGKRQAHELIEKATKIVIAERRHLKEVLQNESIDLPNLDELFKPENAIGQSLDIIDAILQMHSTH